MQINDLEEHLNTDYLTDQFVLIKKNLKNNNIKQRDEWINILTEAGTLKEKLKLINVIELSNEEGQVMTPEEYEKNEKDILMSLAYFKREN